MPRQSYGPTKVQRTSIYYVYIFSVNVKDFYQILKIINLIEHLSDENKNQEINPDSVKINLVRNDGAAGSLQKP